DEGSVIVRHLPIASVGLHESGDVLARLKRADEHEISWWQLIFAPYSPNIPNVERVYTGIHHLDCLCTNIVELLQIIRRCLTIREDDLRAMGTVARCPIQIPALTSRMRLREVTITQVMYGHGGASGEDERQCMSGYEGDVWLVLPQCRCKAQMCPQTGEGYH